jgi:hypothetical protein
MHIFFLTVYLLTTQVLAQHSEQPLQESNADLRHGLVLFKLEVVKNEKVFILERTVNLDHFLRFRDDDKDELIRKIDPKEAKKLEMEFASRFLKCQYELPSIPGDCKVTYRLNLKGEGQDICQKDDKKSREMVPFVESLGKRF